MNRSCNYIFQPVNYNLIFEYMSMTLAFTHVEIIIQKFSKTDRYGGYNSIHIQVGCHYI